METTRTNPLLRLMPSLTDVAFLLPIVFLFSKLDGARTMLGDGDTGWHVRIGEWILAHGQVPTKDFFSYTMPGQPFYAWEWLWDVSFAWIHMHWGLGGVVWVSVLVICSASALLYKLALRRCGNPLVAIGVTALAECGASIHWLARPHLFTLLFMLVFLEILERVARGQASEAGEPHTKLLWLLPVLTVLWTNLHGGFLAGIIFVGAYCGGEVLNALLAPNRAQAKAYVGRAIPYLLTTVGCALASLVNPYFYHLHMHIWEYLHEPFQWQYIIEFQSANFRMDSAMYLEAMLLVGVGSAIWYAMRRRFTEVLLLAGWAHLALVSARNIPIFMMTAAVLVAEPVTAWLKALGEAPIAGWMRAGFTTVREIGEEIVPMERPWRIHLLTALVVAGLAVGIAAPGAGAKLKPEYDPKAYPSGPLAMLGGLGAQGHRIFTHDEWGDYLIYHLSPNGTKVFVDGRSDFYGGKFDQAYIDVMNVKYDWQNTLARYGVDTILLPVDAPLTGAVKESRNWRVVYDDGRAIVFRSVEQYTGRIGQVSASNNGGIGGRDGIPVAAAVGANLEGSQKIKERE